MATVATQNTSITVRMYRQGLGDCFLLTFPTKHSGRSFHMMIDCGLVTGHKTDRQDRRCPSLEEVAQDIKKMSGDKIDILVVTHEHWDHVSGFQTKESKNVFASISIGELWLAWTEDPHDRIAKSLRDNLHRTRDTLRAAIDRAEPNAVAHIANVLDFFGVAGTADAMDSVRALLKKGKPKYLDPKQSNKPLALPDVPGVRIYVLGPPRDIQLIKRILPRSGEAYLTLHSPGESALARAFLLAAKARASGSEKLGVDEKELLNLSCPFNEKLRISIDKAQQHSFFQAHYSAEADEKWRRIDDDWLGVGEELALALDNYTNNTSLALAIELVKSGKVILFSADAQVGNWLSWGELNWNAAEGGAEKMVKIGDLLKRTVLYKVGHHGSINASLKPYVDQMTSPELVAMVPVDHQDALAKRWKDMPWNPLLKELSGQDDRDGSGRVVVRMDEFPTKRPNGMSDADWRAFKANFEENDLYMQYTVKD